MPYSESRETYNLTRKKLFQKNILASHNADHMPPKMLVSGILILTYFGTADLGNPFYAMDQMCPTSMQLTQYQNRSKWEFQRPAFWEACDQHYGRQVCFFEITFFVLNYKSPCFQINANIIHLNYWIANLNYWERIQVPISKDIIARPQ